MAINFNGTPLKCLHTFPRGSAPELHVQRTQFAGVVGVSQIVLGVGGRELSFEVWLTDASFVTAASVDNYRQTLDGLIGAGGTLQITGNAPATFGDCTFVGFEPTGSVLPVLGVGMPVGTFWQAGTLKFFQLTPD
ncbi:MAG TPA: hypothetical protein VG826_29260 [Pirellulales bacterium]|nr:hypothetical protein [Pirellulales bacterium]